MGQRVDKTKPPQQQIMLEIGSRSAPVTKHALETS
jgi:hypothetical protein